MLNKGGSDAASQAPSEYNRPSPAWARLYDKHSLGPTVLESSLNNKLRSECPRNYEGHFPWLQFAKGINANTNPPPLGLDYPSIHKGTKAVEFDQQKGIVFPLRLAYDRRDRDYRSYTSHEAAKLMADDVCKFLTSICEWRKRESQLAREQAPLIPHSYAVIAHLTVASNEFRKPANLASNSNSNERDLGFFRTLPGSPTGMLGALLEEGYLTDTPNLDSLRSDENQRRWGDRIKNLKMKHSSKGKFATPVVVFTFDYEVPAINVRANGIGLAEAEQGFFGASVGCSAASGNLLAAAVPGNAGAGRSNSGLLTAVNSGVWRAIIALPPRNSELD